VNLTDVPQLPHPGLRRYPAPRGLFFKWWLLLGPDDSPKADAAGIALVIGGYALSIAVCYALASLHGA
jgi:hypothetical protein